MSATRAELEAAVERAQAKVLDAAERYAGDGAIVSARMATAAVALQQAQKALRKTTRPRWEVHLIHRTAFGPVAVELRYELRTIAGFASEVEARACASVLDGLAQREGG